MDAEDLRHLIPPDTRRRNAALLAFVCVLVGALLMRGGERLVELRGSGWGMLGTNASRAHRLRVHEAKLMVYEPKLDPPPLFDGTGVMTVICFPACEHVFDNGRDLGESPIWQKQVTAGEHRLKLISANPPATKILTVRIAGDELKTVKQTMNE
jgi:hypothetical protein